MDSEHNTPLVALGHGVNLCTFGCGLTAEEERQGIAIWRAAFVQLDERAREIAPDLAALFARLQEIIMPSSDNAPLGDLGRNPADGRISMAISLAYMLAWSTVFVASLPFHEMTHEMLKGRFAEADLWRSEQAACRNQLFVMGILGAPQDEIDYIEAWSADSNEAQMQAHMAGQFVGPPLQQQQ